VAATLDDDGDVVQMTGMHRLGYGPLDGSRDERLPDVTDALSGEEFDSNPSLTIVRDMWEKWLVLASMGAITTLMRGTLADVNGAPGGKAFSRGVADEAVAIVTAAGHEPRPGAVETLLQQVLSSQPMGSSMFRDMTSGMPVEADAILGDLVVTAERQGVPAPLIAAAYTNLAIYSAKRTF
jgi:2-dehydropantoate 2-reductase